MLEASPARDGGEAGAGGGEAGEDGERPKSSSGDWSGGASCGERLLGVLMGRTVSQAGAMVASSKLGPAARMTPNTRAAAMMARGDGGKLRPGRGVALKIRVLCRLEDARASCDG